MSLQMVLHVIVCLTLAWSPAIQDDPDDPPPETITKTEQARRKMRDLEEKMNRLHQLLAKTEPEQAALLKMAYEQSRDDLILRKMDAILDLLKEEKLDEAIQKQEDVSEALRRLLSLLLDREDDFKKLMEEIKRLEGYEKEIEKLIEEEKREKAESDDRSAGEKRLADLQKAMEAIDDLIAREEEQLEATRVVKAQAGFAPLRAGQEGIREDTEELAFDVDSIDDATGECLGKAAESMADAEEALGGMDQEGATASERRALDHLREAREAVEKERKLLALPDYDEMVQAQDGTKESTDSLARKMKEEGGEEGTPGQKGVAGAGGSMGKASEDLQQRSSSQASEDQQEALDQLAEAKEDVEDALDQLRRELQEELLAALEERFSKMLEQQQGITKRTGEMDTALVGGEGPDRAQKLQLDDLSRGEVDLADQSDDALDLLKEEGSTVVIPMILESMKDDLLQVSGWITAAETGAFTQSVQKDIEATLEDLIEAVRKKQEHAGDCAGGGG